MMELVVSRILGFVNQTCDAAGCTGGGIEAVVNTALNAINSLQGVILGICVALAVLMVAYGGILVLTSAGNPQAVKKGKDTIMWGVIGVVIILYAYTIISWVVMLVNGNGDSSAVTDSVSGTIMMVLNAIFAVIGLIAVIVVLIGGINMMTSAGDPGKMKKSKDTLIWGMIGLIICIFAAAIVNFVIGSIANA